MSSVPDAGSENLTIRLPWLAKAAVILWSVAVVAALYLLGRLGRRPGGLEKFDESF